MSARPASSCTTTARSSSSKASPRSAPEYAGRHAEGGFTMADDMTLSYLPQFATVEEERLHRKQRLAAGFRLFGKFGFEEGVAGHITARDPEHLDHFWVNPFGMNFKQIRVKDLILVDDHGQVVEGNWPVNAAAFAIHSQVHAARPDVVAA